MCVLVSFIIEELPGPALGVHLGQVPASQSVNH